MEKSGGKGEKNRDNFEKRRGEEKREEKKNH